MSGNRPSVFIGSSTEGLPIAEAIQVNLDHACEIVIWSQGVFGLSSNTLISLVERLPDFDFAILVLTPDDLVQSKGGTQQSPRDNVLLELGLCIGALGRQRTFAVYNRESDIKIPSDLAGVTLANYQPHSDGNLQASLGASCTTIKATIQQLGVKSQRSPETEINQNTQFQIIHDLLDDSIEQLFILMGEKDIVVQRDNMFGPGLRYQFSKHDGSAGKGSFSVNDMCRKIADAGLLQQDLRNSVSLTDRGRQFVDWLIERGHKAEYFSSDIGKWGDPPDDWPDIWCSPPPLRPGNDPGKVT